MNVGAAHTAWDDPKYYAAEVAPPGWGHTKAEKEKTKPNKPKSKIGGSAAAFDRARKEGRFKGSKEDMFKLMWWMKNKGGKPKGKPHYKPGTDKKYKKYQEEWQKPNFVKDLPSQDEKRLEKHKEKRDVKKITKKVNEGRVAASYSGGTVTYSDWREKTKLAMKNAQERKERNEKAKEKNEKVRADTRKHGIKFSDAKGTGRIKGGKKVYD